MLVAIKQTAEPRSSSAHGGVVLEDVETEPGPEQGPRTAPIPRLIPRLAGYKKGDAGSQGEAASEMRVRAKCLRRHAERGRPIDFEAVSPVHCIAMVPTRLQDLLERRPAGLHFVAPRPRLRHRSRVNAS